MRLIQPKNQALIEQTGQLEHLWHTHIEREREREREREGRDRGEGERGRERERGGGEREGGERERETVVPREVQRMCPVIINQAAADWRLWPSSSESFSSSWVWTLLNAEHTEGKSNGLWQSSRTACKTQRSSTSTAAICPHPTKDRLFDSRDTAATCHYLIKSLVVSAHHSSLRFFSHYLALPQSRCRVFLFFFSGWVAAYWWTGTQSRQKCPRIMVDWDANAFIKSGAHSITLI